MPSISELRKSYLAIVGEHPVVGWDSAEIERRIEDYLEGQCKQRETSREEAQLEAMRKVRAEARGSLDAFIEKGDTKNQLWHWMIYILEEEAKAQEALTEFIEVFQVNAYDAVSWSEKIFDAAAVVEQTRYIKLQFEEGYSYDEMVADLMRYTISCAAQRPHANLATVHMLAVSARLASSAQEDR